MTTAAAAPVAYDHKHKPYPLDAHAHRHPITFTKRFFGRLVGGLGAVHVGTLAVVGLYYLLFQTVAGVKYDWDHLLTGQFHLWGLHVHWAPLSEAHWTYWRHLVRNVGEGILGGVLGQMILVNYYKKFRENTFLDDLEIGLGIPNAKHVREGDRLSTAQVFLAPLIVLIYAAPGFFIGAGFLALIHHWVDLHTASPGPHASYWTYVSTLWTGNVDQKLVGLFASVVFGRRISKAIGLNTQAWFAERRRRQGKGLRFYHWLSPTFMGRYQGIPEHVYAGAGAETRHGGLQAKLMVGGLTVLLALAGFGYYVVSVIAKGH